jgi:AbrB family looped-hinge helix DNA binding protein
MEQAVRMRVNENGRVVLPAAFRKALDIKPGDEVVGRVEGGEVRITTLKRRIQQAQRRVRRYVKPGTSLAEELIRERREAAKRE